LPSGTPGAARPQLAKVDMSTLAHLLGKLH
jgi:hypothetical protein